MLLGHGEKYSKPLKKNGLLDLLVWSLAFQILKLLFVGFSVFSIIQFPPHQYKEIRCEMPEIPPAAAVRSASSVVLPFVVFLSRLRSPAARRTLWPCLMRRMRGCPAMPCLLDPKVSLPELEGCDAPGIVEMCGNVEPLDTSNGVKLPLLIKPLNIYAN